MAVATPRAGNQELGQPVSESTLLISISLGTCCILWPFLSLPWFLTISDAAVHPVFMGYLLCARHTPGASSLALNEMELAPTCQEE